MFLLKKELLESFADTKTLDSKISFDQIRSWIAKDDCHRNVVTGVVSLFEENVLPRPIKKKADRNRKKQLFPKGFDIQKSLKEACVPEQEGCKFYVDCQCAKQCLYTKRQIRDVLKSSAKKMQKNINSGGGNDEKENEYPI